MIELIFNERVAGLGRIENFCAISGDNFLNHISHMRTHKVQHIVISREAFLSMCLLRFLFLKHSIIASTGIFLANRCRSSPLACPLIQFHTIRGNLNRG